MRRRPATSGLTKNSLASSIVREVFIPALEKEVNEGKNFANLRQIYNSLVLAHWFKSNLKNAVLNKVYADQDKVKGIDLSSKETTEKVYAQYLETFKKGVCNIMKVELDPYTKRSIPRKYFAGGVVGKFGPGEVQIVRNGTAEGRAGSSALLNQLKTATIVLMTVALNLLNTGNLSAQNQNKNLPSISYRTPVSAENASGSLFYEKDGYGTQAAKMGVIHGSLWKSVKEVAWQRAALSLTNKETSELLRILLAENPDLEDPDRIRSGQTFDMHDVVNAIEVKYHLDHAKLIHGQKIKNGDKDIEIFFLDSLGNKPNKYVESYHGINFDDKIVVFSFAIAQWAEEAGKGYSGEGREDLFTRYLKDVVRHEVLHAFLYPKIDQGLYKSPAMGSLFQKYSIPSDQYYRVTEELAAYLGQIAKAEDPRFTLADFLWKMNQPGKLGDIYASVRTVILEEMFQKLNKGDWRELWGSSGYSSEQEFLRSLGVTDEEFNKAAQELFEEYFGPMPEFDLEIPAEVIENYREKYQQEGRGGASSSLLSEDDLAMQFLFSTENFLRDEAYFQNIVQTDKVFVKTLFDINFDPKSTARDRKVIQDVLAAKGLAFELNQETAVAIAYPLEGEKLGIKAIYDVPTGAHVFLKGRHFDVAKLVNPKMSETLGFEYQLVKVDGKYVVVGAQFSSGGLDFMTFKAPYSQVQLTREMLDKSAQQMNRHIGLSFQKGADIYGVSADYQSKLQSSASPLVSESNSSDTKKYTSNRSAQDYRDNLYHAGLLDIFEFIKATIKRKGKFRYYDAGTGLGVAPTEIKILYPREADVYGSDIDDKTVENIGENVLKGLYERFTPEEAKKYFSGKRTFRYETGDVSEKKFLDESGQPVLMDLITSLYVLQYTKDPFKAWLNLFHQLADGGVFVSQLLFFNDEQGLKNLAAYRAIFSAMQDAGIKVQMSAPFVNEKGEISMFISAARTGEQEIRLNIAVDAINEVEVQAFDENRTYTVYEVSYVGLGAPQQIVQVSGSSSSLTTQTQNGAAVSAQSRIAGSALNTKNAKGSLPNFYMMNMTLKEWAFFAISQQAVSQGQGHGSAIDYPLEASINNCLCVVFPEKKVMFHFTELNYLMTVGKNKVDFLKSIFNGLGEDSAVIVDNRKMQGGVTVEDIQGVLPNSVVVPENTETYRHILLSTDGRVLIVDEKEKPGESALSTRSIYEKSLILSDSWNRGNLGKLYSSGDAPDIKGFSPSIPADFAIGSRSVKAFLKEGDLDRLKREFLRLNLQERLDPDPSILDLLTRQAYLYVTTNDRKEYGIRNVNLLREGWISTDVSLSFVDMIFKTDLVKEIAEGAKAQPDKIFRIVDWGTGEMTKDGLLPGILKSLRERYPEVRNVQLIGFANALFPQWANVDPAIELWWGDANQFFGFVQEKKVDLIIRMDLIISESIRKKDIQDQKEEFLNYLINLGITLNDSGKVFLTYERFRSDSLDNKGEDLAQILHRFFDISNPSFSQTTKANIAILQRKNIFDKVSSAIPSDLWQIAQYAASRVPPGLPNGCKIASDLIAPQDKPQKPRLAATYGFLLQESIYINDREHVFVDVGSWVIDTQLRQFKLPISEEFINQFVYEKSVYLKTLWNYLDQSTKARYADIGRKVFVQQMVSFDGQGARKNEGQIRQLIQRFIEDEKQFIPTLHQLYFSERISQDARAIIEDVLLEHGRAFELTDRTVEKIAMLDKDGIWKFKAVVDTTNNSNIAVFFNERFEESNGNMMEHFKVAQGINKNVAKTLGLKYQAQKGPDGKFVVRAADFFSSSLEVWVFPENTLTNAIVQGAHKAIQDHIKIKTQILGDGTYTVSKPLLDKLAPEEKVAFSKTGEQLEIPFAEFQEDVGGIDFNSKNFNIERQGSASPIQFNASDLGNIQIDGLYPVIINITPVTNLPLLLGARQENAPQLSLAR